MPVRQLDLRGEVIRVDVRNRIATIRHQKIESWMEAMTMDFPLRDEVDLSKLNPGSQIQATVYLEHPSFTLGNVRASGLDY
jgi:Cu/Ag efflux protein CusF